MCGICGYVNYKKINKLHVIEEMAKAQSHRGPNDMGTFSYKNDLYDLALGHVRLSILDLSEQGHQPMTFNNYTIVFNGEIYNYKEIRNELIALGHIFNSNCDTEVVLHAFSEWGETCEERFIGMFAFAIFNQSENKLFLCRDRAGIKPLYYYSDGDTFIFGSELKTFNCHPLFKKQLDNDSIGLYMKLGYIPAPYTIYKDAKKLQQGHYLTLDLNKRDVNIQRYWSLIDYYTAPKLDISYESALNEVERILKSSFNYRMVSDVPVGVFLSAGFDSTCVAALLQSTTEKRIKTFTIGFEGGSDEAPRARMIANHLNTDHNEYYCSIQEGLKLIEQLPYYYDEPFADSSAIPTMLVSKIASKDVSVVLSADGGDEVFAGYNRYDKLLKRYHQFEKIPQSLYGTTAEIAGLLSSLSTNRHTKWQYELFSNILKEGKVDLQTSFIQNMFNNDFSGYQVKMFTFDCQPQLPILSDDMHKMDILSKLLYIDYSQYMCDDILVKVDRATMSVSIEGRDPLLDQRIIEFAARIPSEYKYDGNVKKRILKDIVYKYVPKDLMDMPKTGFAIPLADWLQNGLNDYVSHYLSSSEIKKTGVFNMDYIELCRDNFNENPTQNASNIWRLLQFQMWYDRWMVN